MKINSEKGSALLLVMLAILLGAMVIPPFLGHADSSLIGSRAYTNAIYTQYALDSGVEHAIWKITDGGIPLILDTPGETTSYTLPEEINGLTPTVKICNSYQAIATDNFNSGGWTGGTGWVDNWTHSGDAAIVYTGTTYEGPYHLRLRSNTGIAKRSVNLANEISVHLQFWAKVNDFEDEETALCQISSDNNTWYTVYTWTIGNSDNIYHHYDINLSSYEMTSRFWISFTSNMSGTMDYFYVDKLEVIWLAMAPVIQASDDFESGDGTGGEGWLDNWTLLGNAYITGEGVPYEGDYHLRLRSYYAIARRSVDLSDAFMATLQFWAKVDNFEGWDAAYCRVSSDNITWNTVYTWTRANSDNTYHFYSIDLSSYELTSRFWISFEAGMNSTGDYFYVDNLNASKIDAYGITVTIGDDVVKAVVRVTDGNVAIINWYYL
jgi:hypothetical protein